MVNYLHHIGKQYKCKRLSCFVFCFFSIRQKCKRGRDLFSDIDGNIDLK